MVAHPVERIQRGEASPGATVWSRQRPHGPVSLGTVEQLVSFQVRRAQAALTQGFQAKLRAYDLSLMQYAVLSVMQENPGLSQTDLGNALGIDRSTMVAIIDRLQGRNLVYRESSPQDRRSYALILTAEGKALLRTIAPIVDAYEAEITSDLNEAERGQLLSLVQRLQCNAGDQA